MTAQKNCYVQFHVLRAAPEKGLASRLLQYTAAISLLSAGAGFFAAAPLHTALANDAGGTNGQMIIGALPARPEPVDISRELGMPERTAQSGATDFSVQDITGDASSPLAFGIRLPRNDSAQYTFVMIKGLPAGFKASSGFQTKDSWIVSIADIRNLTLTAPAGFSGEFGVEVLLIKGMDSAPESRKARISIRGPRGGHPQAAYQPAPQPAKPAAASPPPVTAAMPPAAEPAARKAPEAASAPASQSGISRDDENAGMKRAELFLSNSDIAAARLMFENLALRGSARAAFAMGQTYDPEFLKTMAVNGLKPDVEQAKSWYRKALELGSSEASGRLSALSQTIR